MSSREIEGLTVEIEGTGPAVMMVHGLGGTSNTFTPLAGPLVSRFQVIRPDLPGAGRSRMDPSATLPDIAGRLLRLVDALGVDEVQLVGHSLGTVLCQQLAVLAPARVRRMMLFGPVLEPPEAGRQALRERAAAARLHGMSDIADAIVAGSLARETRADRPLVVALVRELLMRQPPEGYARLCEALADARKVELGVIGCPVLLVTGDQDPTSPAAACEAMCAALPQAQLEILPECGHWACLEQVDAGRHLLARFLD
ncbi:MAG: alpha/beta fold hydrolase [Gammaproteobacteria bacterium]